MHRVPMCSVVSGVSNSFPPHALHPVSLLCPWHSPARILEWAAISFSTLELISEASIHFFYLLLGNCNPVFLRPMKANVQRILKF